MNFSAKEIAQLVNGRVEGDEKKQINKIAKIEEGDEMSLCFIGNPKYEHFLYTSDAGIVLINETFQLKSPVQKTLIRVSDAYGAFASLMESYQRMMAPKKKTGVESNSFIHDSALVKENVYIGSFSYIDRNAVIEEGVQIYPQVFVGEGVKIGKGSILHPGVKVYAGCEIGKDVLIHAGAVIGSDGFGFAPTTDGRFKKVPQLGNVVIEDHVEIGANTTIDRATMGSTIIKENVKLDNLVQIAHNVVLGENTAVAAQTGISGSTKIGKNCLIGGQTGIVGHLEIADHTTFAARSGVSKSIKEPGTVLSGFFASENKSAMKSQVIYRNLPEWMERIKDLEKKVNCNV